MGHDNSGGTVSRLDDGIFLIPGRRGGGCNVFVLKGTRKTMLIDVGLASDHAHLGAGLKELGLGLGDIQMVLLTHEHVDHVGGVHLLPASMLVAAHGRVADKIRLNDEFSTMSGAFNVGLEKFHVDIHLEDGMIIDLGGIRLRVLYTPGHSSGSICFYETTRGGLFSGDTIFAGGVLGGIFSSGNLSDYISSLERLKELRLDAMYPSHGRMSSNPKADMERAIRGSAELMSDTHRLFDSIKIDGSFQQIMRATATYSRRAAERRGDARVSLASEILIHEAEADHPAQLVDISGKGARIDRIINLAVGSRIAVTIPQLGRLESKVVSHDQGNTRIEFLRTRGNRDNLMEWIAAKRQ